MSVRCALLQAAIGEVFPEATISVLLSSDVLDCYTWAEYSPTLDEVAMQQRVGLAHCMSSLKEEGALLKVCVCVRSVVARWKQRWTTVQLMRKKHGREPTGALAMRI